MGRGHVDEFVLLRPRGRGGRFGGGPQSSGRDLFRLRFRGAPGVQHRLEQDLVHRQKQPRLARSVADERRLEISEHRAPHPLGQRRSGAQRHTDRLCRRHHPPGDDRAGGVPDRSGNYAPFRAAGRQDAAVQLHRRSARNLHDLQQQRVAGFVIGPRRLGRSRTAGGRTQAGDRDRRNPDPERRRRAQRYDHVHGRGAGRAARGERLAGGRRSDAAAHRLGTAGAHHAAVGRSDRLGDAPARAVGLPRGRPDRHGIPAHAADAAPLRRGADGRRTGNRSRSGLPRPPLFQHGGSASGSTGPTSERTGKRTPCNTFRHAPAGIRTLRKGKPAARQQPRREDRRSRFRACLSSQEPDACSNSSNKASSLPDESTGIR